MPAARQWAVRQVQEQKSAHFMGISLQTAGDLQSARRTQEVREREIQLKMAFIVTGTTFNQ